MQAPSAKRGRKFSNFDEHEKVAKNIASYLIENKLPIDNLDDSLCNPGSIWGLISININNFYSYTKSLLYQSWWSRDVECFRNKVQNEINSILPFEDYTKKKRKDRHSEEENDFNNEEAILCFDLKFTKKEWEDANIYISKTKRLKYFKVGFRDAITRKLNNEGIIICKLAENSNFFSVNKDPTVSTKYWQGNFVCSENKEIKYTTVIKKEPNFEEKDFFLMEIKRTSVCEDLHLKKRNFSFTGQIRIAEKSKIASQGITMTKACNAIENNDNLFHKNFIKNELPIDNNRLKQIKYEFINRDRISNDILIDSIAAKKMSDTLIPTSNNELQGYIQSISQIPFGVLLVSQYQVDMWNIVNKENDNFLSLHFDSTGNVLKNLLDQKRPFLYSLVFRDPVKKLIIPVAEFLTTSHTSNNIAAYLLAIKNIYDEHKIGKISYFAPLIITDFSWALIIAVLKSFNGCNVNEYLMWCFDISIDKKYINLNTRIFLCSVHFLKNIVIKTKKILLDDLNSDSLTKEEKAFKEKKIYLPVKKSFLFCFTLLQSSNTVAEFDAFLENIFIIFCLEFQSEIVENAIKFMKLRVSRRYLEKCEESENKTFVGNSCLSDKKTNNYYDCNELGDTKKTSKFTAFYDNKVKEFNSRYEQENKKSEKRNIYFNINLFKLIQDSFYIIPFWTCLLTKNYLPNNNNVENHFGQIKNNILNNRKLTISEISSLFLKRINSFHIQYADKIKFDFKKTLIFEEKWDKGDKKKNNSKNKGFYYSNDTTGFIVEKTCNSEARGSGLSKFSSVNPVWNSEKVFGESDEDDELSIISCSNIRIENKNLMTSYICKIVNNSNAGLSFSNNKTEGYHFLQLYEQLRFTKSLETMQNLLNDNRSLVDKITFHYQIIRENIKFNSVYHKSDENFYSLLSYHGLLDSFKAVSVIPDGNCLYRAFSISLLGNENDFLFIKICCLINMIQKSDFFFKLLKKHEGNNINIENYISKYLQLDEWGNDVCILSISMLLERPIYLFTKIYQGEVNLEKNKLTIKNIFKFSRNQEKITPIMLVLENNHFLPILSINENFSIREPYFIKYSGYNLV